MPIERGLATYLLASQGLDNLGTAGPNLAKNNGIFRCLDLLDRLPDKVKAEKVHDPGDY